MKMWNEDDEKRLKEALGPSVKAHEENKKLRTLLNELAEAARAARFGVDGLVRGAGRLSDADERLRSAVVEAAMFLLKTRPK